jgi:hypothetical protein
MLGQIGGFRDYIKRVIDNAADPLHMNPLDKEYKSKYEKNRDRIKKLDRVILKIKQNLN